MGHQRRRELLLHLWSSGHFAKDCPIRKGKGKNGKGLDKGKDKGCGRYQGYGYQGACHHCGKVGHERAECWKYWKDHQNQIRAVDELEGEAIEQEERQTCWMLCPFQRLLGPGRGSWQVLILRLRDSDSVQLMAVVARMHVAIISRFWTRRRTVTSMR